MMFKTHSWGVFRNQRFKIYQTYISVLSILCERGFPIAKRFRLLKKKHFFKTYFNECTGDVTPDVVSSPRKKKI